MSTTTLSPPPLVQGQRLDEDEFLRRYEAMPDVKAELINGVVCIMASPVSTDHSDSHVDLAGFVAYYRAFTPGVGANDNATTRLKPGNIPQPDVLLRVLDSHGGKTTIGADRYLHGAPELIGEVAWSSLDYDRDTKRPLYQKAGVREFILWNVEEQLIEWSILRGKEFEFLMPDSDGIIRSEAFPGLWLDVEAMVRRDTGSVFRILQQGIASPEHARFVEKLQAAAKKG